MTEQLGDFELDTVIHTDALSLLKGLPDGSVNCCVTSPPYYGLRDYGVAGQLGLEATPAAYVAALVEVFREVKRALRDDGVVFLNLGDSYNGTGGGHTKAAMGKASYNVGDYPPGGKFVKGLKPKDLLGIPWRVAFALQADGWYLRSEIIWHKPNCMPESVHDRPTKAHETVFLLSKCGDYYYDHEAVKERAVEGTDLGILRSKPHTNGDYVAWHAPSIKRRQDAGIDSRTAGTGFRNKRSVWTIPTQPFPGAHFAVMPEALVEPCILAGCPETVCAVCGAPYERVVERESISLRPNSDSIRGNSPSHSRAVGGNPQRGSVASAVTTLGFSPTCACNAETRPGICIDPFGGAATVGVVAKRLNRHYLLSEINPVYVELARDRLAGVTPMLPLFAQVQP